MPSYTADALIIFVLDKLIFLHLVDNVFSPFSKHTNFYEMFLIV